MKPTVPAPAPGAVSALGTWRGYIEAFSFDSGSDRVEIVLDQATPERLTGRARLGSLEASLPPSPEDIDAGPQYRRWRSGGFVEGADLEIKSGGIERTRVQFVAEHRAWRAWCQRQTPKPGPAYLDAWGCPIHGYQQGDECRVSTSSSATIGGVDAGMPRRKAVPAPSLPFDCAEINRCLTLRSSCECKSDKCDGDVTASAHFDLVIDGSKADGSVSFHGETRRIRLEKAL